MINQEMKSTPSAASSAETKRFGLPQLLPKPRGPGQTQRTDRWWLDPLPVFFGLGGFIIYATWAAFQGVNYFVEGTGYISPMYSPLLFESWRVAAPSGHAWFGAWPSWIPHAILFQPLTPAVLILWAPGGFRFTCYYYRGSYYKAFWGDPPSCAVGEPRFRGRRYLGESTLPLIIQNGHRYLMSIALVFVVLLCMDAVRSYWFLDRATGHWGPGMGLGSLVLTINPILLGGYTLGCHSLRHLVGGRLDKLSHRKRQKKVYDCVSCLNRRHALWAWMSMLWVMFADLYVRMVACGRWEDLRLF